MQREAFIQLVSTVAKGSVRNADRIGSLVLHKFRKGWRIREPEMRDALTQAAAKQGLLYGVEVPTEGAYRFRDCAIGLRCALHDLVLFEEANGSPSRDVLIELKAGQPGWRYDDVGKKHDCPSIRKDFEKLLHESAGQGRAFLHLLHAANKRTRLRLMERYSTAVRAARAKKHLANRLEQDDKWFELFVVVQHDRRRAQKPSIWRYGGNLTVHGLMNDRFQFKDEDLERIVED